MNDIVKLTKEQADGLEVARYNRSDEEVVIIHSKNPNGWDTQNRVTSLNGMGLDTLIRALYIGYEVEKTPEEQLLDVYCQLSYSEFGEVGKDAIKRTLEIMNIKVKGINK